MMATCGQERIREATLRGLLAEDALLGERDGHNESGVLIKLGSMRVGYCVSCGCPTTGVILEAPVRCGMSGCEGPA